ALYFVVIYLLVPRARLMPLGLLRIVCIHDLLCHDLASSPQPFVAALGTSVTREGIDAKAVERHLSPSTRFFNFACSGPKRPWLLLFPALAQARPKAVVLGIDGFQLDPPPIGAEQLALAAWWDFIPAVDLPRYRELLTPDEYQ